MELIDVVFVNGSARDFAEAIKVLILKPNVVNKRLVGAKILDSKIKRFTSEQSVGSNTKETASAVVDEWLKNHLLQQAKLIRKSTSSLSECNENGRQVPDLASVTKGSCEILRKCIIKQRFQNSEQKPSSSNNESENCQYETIIWESYSDFSTTIIVHFISYTSSDPSFAFVYESCEKSKNNVNEVIEENIRNESFGKVKLWVEQRNDANNTCDSNTNHHRQVDNSGWLQWLKSRCFKQLVKWCNAEIGCIGD